MPLRVLRTLARSVGIFRNSQCLAGLPGKRLDLAAGPRGRGWLFRKLVEDEKQGHAGQSKGGVAGGWCVEEPGWRVVAPCAGACQRRRMASR